MHGGYHDKGRMVGSKRSVGTSGIMERFKEGIRKQG